MNTLSINPTVKTITFSSDGLQLKGKLHLPDAHKPPVVIGSHGLLSAGDSPKQIAMAKACISVGIACFRFSHRGCGESEGSFKDDTSFEGRCNDLLSAINTVRSLPEIGDRFGVFGSSLGGAIALSVAAALKPDAVITYAAPVNSDTLKDAFNRLKEENKLVRSIHKNGLLFDLSGKLSQISRILIIHGDADKVVPVANAHELFSGVAEPKKLVIQKTGDHPMGNIRHQEEFINESAQWFHFLLASN